MTDNIEPLYTAVATATGGRYGKVVTPDGALDLDLVRPVGMGGDPEGPLGTNPEQLFAAGYSACFHGSLLYAAGLRGLEVDDARVSAQISIGRSDGGLGLMAVLEVSMPGVPERTAVALVDKAHQLCPYSRATRGNMPVEVQLVKADHPRNTHESPRQT